MSTNDTNATPQQRRPKNVTPREQDRDWLDNQSEAPPAAQPGGVKDESERPVVNPVTGGAL